MLANPVTMNQVMLKSVEVSIYFTSNPSRAYTSYTPENALFTFK